jgi:hypothetical protein
MWRVSILQTVRSVQMACSYDNLHDPSACRWEGMDILRAANPPPVGNSHTTPNGQSPVAIFRRIQSNVATFGRVIAALLELIE